MMFVASCLASGLVPLLSSVVAIVIAPWWWAVIMVSHFWSNIVPDSPVRVLMSAALIIPGNPLLDIPAIPPAVVVVGAGLPQEVRSDVILSISGCCSPLIVVASCITAGVVVRPSISVAMSTACAWWGYICCRKVTSVSLNTAAALDVMLDVVLEVALDVVLPVPPLLQPATVRATATVAAAMTGREVVIR